MEIACLKSHPRYRRIRGACPGFTLIELLVVVGIIALLVAILLPSLATARKQAKAVMCANHMKQFGVASIMYTQAYQGYLPCEGMADGDVPSKPVGLWDDPSFWANALPHIINKAFPSYCKMQEAHMGGGPRLPSSGSSSIFVCPLAPPAQAGQTPAEVDGDGYFLMFGIKPGSTSYTGPKEQRPVYWCYVYNSGLDNLINAGTVDNFGTRHFKADFIKRPAQVPILVEKLMSPDECDPQFADHLNRCKTKANSWDSCRLATRHRAGANLMFADGGVGWISRRQATTDSLGDGSYRQTGQVIWQPY